MSFKTFKPGEYVRIHDLAGRPLLAKIVTKSINNICEYSLKTVVGGISLYRTSNRIEQLSDEEAMLIKLEN